jgi:two-component sensor histidine kinase
MSRQFNSRFLSSLIPLVVVGASTVLFYFALRRAGMSADWLIICAALVGAALMRWRVPVLILTSTAFVVVTLIVRFTAANNGLRSILGNVLTVNAAHQIGYLFGITASSYFAILHKGMLALMPAARDQLVRVRDQSGGQEGETTPTSGQSLSLGSSERTSNDLIRADRSRSPFSSTPTGDLLRTVESLAEAGSPDAILEIIRTSARRLIGSDGVALILTEGDECHYVEEDAVGPLWKGRKFKMTECISGWSMINKKTAVIPDVSIDDRIPHHLYMKTFVKSLVMTPVGGEHSLGALGGYWASTYQPTDYEIETVETLARATAAALKNANLVSTLSQSLADAEIKHRELHHRAENAYLRAQALAHSSLPAGWAEVFSAGVESLAQTHEAIDEKLARLGRIDIRELIQTELGVYAAATPGRLTIDGVPLLLGREQAIALGVVVHNLAANAMRDDAQSPFDVRWHVDGATLVLEWRETRNQKGRSKAPNTNGRSRLLSRLIENQLGGRINRRLKDNKTIWRIDIPLQEQDSLQGKATLASPPLSRA